MKTTIQKRIGALAFASALILGLQPSRAPAQGTAFTYQGRLESGGAPANGLYDFRFALYDMPRHGRLIGGPVTNTAVAVSNGLFSVLVDFGEGVFGGGPAWLEIGVRPSGPLPFTALKELQPVTPTPYAMLAGNVSGVISNSSLPVNPVFSGLVTAGGFAGNGSGLTALNADQLSSGTVPNARLSANVSLLGQSIESGEITDGTIVNADISPSAAIADTKLATISSAGKVANSATTATSANTPNAIVARDGSGNFAAAAITASSFSGNGAGLTGLNASQLSSGTVPDARLAANVARTNQVWLLGGNGGTTPGTHFLGTTDNQPLEIKVNGQRAMRIEPSTASAPNVIGGYVGNYVWFGIVGATIAGGGAGNWYGMAFTNRVLADFGTVGGGRGNTASGQSATVGGGFECNASGLAATVGGGIGNSASGYYSTTSGGAYNIASGDASIASGGYGNIAAGYFATIPGGDDNFATNHAFAAGHRAKAIHTGSFVWGDWTGADIASAADNSVTFRASGGYRLFSSGGATTGVSLAPGGGSWTSLSDRHAKEDFQPVNPLEVLEKVARLPVSTWRYKSQDPSIRHIGPNAQDFKAAFGVGESDTGITAVDADGVALAAIQGLNQKLAEELKRRDAQNAELRRELTELRQQLQSLAARLNGTTR